MSLEWDGKPIGYSRDANGSLHLESDLCLIKDLTAENEKLKGEIAAARIDNLRLREALEIADEYICACADEFPEGSEGEMQCLKDHKYVTVILSTPLDTSSLEAIKKDAGKEWLIAFRQGIPTDADGKSDCLYQLDNFMEANGFIERTPT
jgi:hypothetical protein